MPSPFPGMDPYLESPEFFPGLHDRLITRVSDVLQEGLPDHYFADIRSRTWIDLSQGLQDEMRESFLEVYTDRGGRRLVTAIEVLSLANKTPGDQGRDLFQARQRELLRCGANIVEIDLLRGGQATTALPANRFSARSDQFDYHVCVRHSNERTQLYVYLIRLEKQLPKFAVPLLPGDPDVPLDLQAVFDHCYDLGPYRRVQPYREGPPVPPLRPDQAAWAGQLLRDKGLLS